METFSPKKKQINERSSKNKQKSMYHYLMEHKNREKQRLLSENMEQSYWKRKIMDDDAFELYKLNPEMFRNLKDIFNLFVLVIWRFSYNMNI